MIIESVLGYLSLLQKAPVLKIVFPIIGASFVLMGVNYWTTLVENPLLLGVGIPVTGVCLLTFFTWKFG